VTINIAHWVGDPTLTSKFRLLIIINKEHEIVFGNDIFFVDVLQVSIPLALLAVFFFFFLNFYFFFFKVTIQIND
jgi:hypothetical protein